MSEPQRTYQLIYPDKRTVMAEQLIQWYTDEETTKWMSRELPKGGIDPDSDEWFNATSAYATSVKNNTTVEEAIKGLEDMGLVTIQNPK